MINEPEKTKLLRKLKRMIRRYGDMSCNHCGHEVFVMRCLNYEDKIVEFVREEIMGGGGE